MVAILQPFVVEKRSRKARKTTNALFLTDRNGLPFAMTTPVAGNHHDLYQIEDKLGELFEGVKKADICLDGLFINADSGFDSQLFRSTCLREGIIANLDFNYRNGDKSQDHLLDPLLYKERYSIERTNPWIDAFRTLLNRFDKTNSSWIGFNYIAFGVLLLRKVQKNKKFR